MKTLKKHLKKKLAGREFKERYKEEKERLRLAIQVREERNRLKISQKELADMAGLTQQEVSRLETATEPKFTLSTVMKVAEALSMTLVLMPEESRPGTMPAKRLEDPHAPA